MNSDAAVISVGDYGRCANSSTFHPPSGKGHRDLFCLLHALIQHASTSLAIIFRRIDSGVPWFLRSTRVLMSFRISAGAVSSAGTYVGRDSLETSGNRVLDIMCLTWDEWS